MSHHASLINNLKRILFLLPVGRFKRLEIRQCYSLQDVLLVVLLDLELVSDPQDSVLVGGQGGPGDIDGLGGGHARLGEVGEEGSEDVPGELGVAGRHGQVLAPNVGEDVLEVVAVGNTHVDLA